MFFMAFIQIQNLNIDKLLEFIKEILNRIFNQPLWLKILLFSTLILTSGYFYNRHKTDLENIKQVKEQVEYLNCTVNKHLNIEEYKNNLIYVIHSIQLLEYVLQQNYEERMLQLDYLIEFAQEYHPNNELERHLVSMKTRMEVNRNMYNQQYRYIIMHLNDIIVPPDSIQSKNSIWQNSEYGNIQKK